MKTRKAISAIRFGELVATVIWSAHWHGGQGSREYRMGCRARKLIENSMEVGRFVLTRAFDSLEHYVTGESLNCGIYRGSVVSASAKRKYQKLQAFSEKKSGKFVEFPC